jgi:hypothetical protein
MEPAGCGLPHVTGETFSVKPSADIAVVAAAVL